MRDILVKPVEPGQDALSWENNFSVVQMVWNGHCLSSYLPGTDATPRTNDLG